MKKFTGFEHGIGMGGWLTNYKRFAVMDPARRKWISPGDMEHFASYITREDVKNIASFGADHIRLGFDQIVVEEAEHPYVYREVILQKLEEFFGWCEEFGLHVMLNMHKALGAYCDCTDEQDLCTNPELRDRFKALWILLEERFHDRDYIAFELLNELNTPDSRDWNSLADETLAEIRKRNPHRYVVIGSASWNSVWTLKDLHLWDDDKVVYTFHFYDPFEFTHQRGLLQGDQHIYNREMPYPCSMERYREFRRYFGMAEGDYADYDRMDREWLWAHLQPAADWIGKHPDRILYNGEFGTIRHCPIPYRLAWFRDVIAFCKKYEIPYSIWNYLSTPYDGNRFSLVDDDFRRILSPEFIELIRGNVE
ncbi:MAG: cellulase family glycosylhydrolase [Clostridia bacterium]|nr:cellulase family glycosylhydrolase [Clostridia bacterium]